jgi:hypothetical protein
LRQAVALRGTNAAISLPWLCLCRSAHMAQSIAKDRPKAAVRTASGLEKEAPTPLRKVCPARLVQFVAKYPCPDKVRPARLWRRSSKCLS